DVAEIEDLQWDQSFVFAENGPVFPRINARRKMYPDDGNKYHLIRYNDYDGYGHFGSEVHSGNIGRDAREQRTTWTADNNNWILDKYTLKQTYTGTTKAAET